jgi:tetratricopeptide (TPR) repeat protein
MVSAMSKTTSKAGHQPTMDKPNKRPIDLEKLAKLRAGELNPAEARELRAQIAGDPFYEDAMEGFAVLGDKEAVKASVDELKGRLQKHLQAEKRKPGNRLLWYSMAAVVLASLVLLPFVSFAPPSAQEVFSQNFEPYPNIIPLVRGEQSLTPLQEGLMAYERQETAAAIAKLSQAMQNPESKTVAGFYLANLYMQEKQAELAVPLLQSVSQTDGHRLQPIAKWYLGLAYLQLGRCDEAKAVLQSVAKGGSAYQAPAAKIIETHIQNK